ncbi:MAG: hypothetical protein JWQ78_970 [Sediminibacterium sp.]|nr:hypothetical protein [Sediminibacterium sp.]
MYLFSCDAFRIIACNKFRSGPFDTTNLNIMKTLFVALLVFTGLQSYAQWPWEKIEGNGRLSKETRQLNDYTAITSAGSWDVMIAYGESNSIQLEGDENLLPYIETKVENGKLSIKTTKNVNLRSKNKITVYVSLTRLTGISLSGSGDIIGKGRFSNDGTSEFRLSGSGSIQVSLDKVRAAEVSISGSGNIRLSGSANTVTARISGSGNADCGDLICEDATAHVSGSGDVKLNANKSVEASISGSGNVSYRGAASDVRKHVAGSGRLVRG